MKKPSKRHLRTLLHIIADFMQIIGILRTKGLLSRLNGFSFCLAIITTVTIPSVQISDKLPALSRYAPSYLPPKIIQHHFAYLGELMLWHGTSRLWPSSSWLRSTIPHGAIPMLTTRPVFCWPSSKSASPTCFVTPVRNTKRIIKIQLPVKYLQSSAH